jgi:hypothetical protein
MSAARLTEVTEKWNVLSVYEFEELLLEIAAALQAGAFETGPRADAMRFAHELMEIGQLKGNAIAAKQQLARAIWAA